MHKITSKINYKETISQNYANNNNNNDGDDDEQTEKNLPLFGKTSDGGVFRASVRINLHNKFC